MVLLLVYIQIYHFKMTTDQFEVVSVRFISQLIPFPVASFQAPERLRNFRCFMYHNSSNFQNILKPTPLYTPAVTRDAMVSATLKTAPDVHLKPFLFVALCW